MLIAPTLLMLVIAAPGSAARDIGVIRGTVVNRSEAVPRPCAAMVVLRVRAEGAYQPFREVASDAQGRFQFEQLPVGPNCHYQVGANRDGIHYPGPRLALSEEEPVAAVPLTVYNAVTSPNPLVIEQFEIDIQPQPGALKVTESLVIDNPSSTSYVGESEAGAEPITLRLSIPPDFERTTFREEFFGRHFTLADGKLVTSVPWVPGRRELKYTYILPNTGAYRRWQRPLDLPCRQAHLRVHGVPASEVQCSLPAQPDAGGDDLAFAATEPLLPAGHRLTVEFGHLPVSWTRYARWAALAVLVVLICAAAGMMFRRPRRGAGVVESGHPRRKPTTGH